MYTRGHYCNESDAKPFLNMFSLTGVCEEVLEKYIDALSAVSGSGVAFVSYWSTHENTFVVHYCHDAKFVHTVHACSIRKFTNSYSTNYYVDPVKHTII